MSALLQADVLDIRRAAAVLAVVDDEAAALAERLRRQPLVCWASPSGRDYRVQLEQLAGRLSALSRAHEQAGQVVLAYVVVLAEAQQQAARGAALQTVGAERSRAWCATTVSSGAVGAEPGATARVSVSGPDLGAAQVLAGQRAVAEAELQERFAAAQAAALLRQIAGSAPSVSRLDRGVQVADDVIRTAVGGVTGAPGALGALGRAAWGALPHQDREQQRAGRAVLKDAAQVWEQIPPWWEDLTGGRPGLAMGAVVFGPRQLIDGPQKLDGYLAGAHEHDLRITDVEDAWVQALAARALEERILALRALPPMAMDELIRSDVELARHEGGPTGGHAIERHVAVRHDTLEGRLMIERTGADPRRSTFPDLATAELLIGVALRSQARELRSFASSRARVLNLRSVTLPAPTGSVVRPDGPPRPGRFVNVTVVRRPDGGFGILTAFVDDVPRQESRR